MARKKLLLTIKRVDSDVLPFLYSLYANDVVLSQSCCASWLVCQALEMELLNPQIYILDKKLSAIDKLLNASFDEKK